METTKDGFTFTRKAPNKQMSLSCEKIKTTQAYGGEKQMTAPGCTRVVEDEFVFNRVSSNPKLGAGSRKAVGKEAGGLAFGASKKRRTIQMEQSIDLSTDVSLLQSYPEFKVPMLARSNAEDRAVWVDAPAQKGRTRSHEIHKRVLSNNINDLIKECIYFLRDNSEYAREIVKHCNSNYFSDIDYRKEIELANSRSEQIKSEIDKWNNVFLEEKALNAVAIPELGSESVGWKAAECEDNDALERKLAEEFEEKARRLLDLEGKLQYFFENAKEKSDSLLKSIFGSLEEKNVDAIFLLRAMSKLGR